MVCDIIIGALSGQKMQDRRANCRETWFRDAHEKGLGAYFLLGDEKVSVPTVTADADDELRLPCPDAYATLPQRTRWFCKWALERSDWTYLFKCDDDTLVIVDRLIAAKPTADYVGRDLGGWASGGAGYWLSRRAAKIVAEKMQDRTGNEDQRVAWTLKRNGIRLVNDERYCPWAQDRHFPKRDNSIVTTHATSGTVFRDAYYESASPWTFDILITTSNKYAKTVLPITLALLDQYWPHHPPITVVHYEVRPEPYDGVRYFSAGEQAKVSWTDAVAAATEGPGEVLLMLDDYGLCLSPKFDELLRGYRAMSINATECLHLTWQPTDAKRPKLSVNGIRMISFGPWPYLVNTQVCLWRSKSLANLCNKMPGRTIEAFELEGSELAREMSIDGFDILDPPSPSAFVDSTEKTNWIIPYNNLVRRGRIDARHSQFLKSKGFCIKHQNSGNKL